MKAQKDFIIISYGCLDPSAVCVCVCAWYVCVPACVRACMHVCACLEDFDDGTTFVSMAKLQGAAGTLKTVQDVVFGLNLLFDSEKLVMLLT